MKKIILLSIAYTAFQILIPLYAPAQSRACGVHSWHESLAQNPAAAQKLADQRNSLQAVADYYSAYRKAHQAKTTDLAAVPIVFHIIVDTAQFISLGGTAGIIQRCDSQLAVLNRDFNRENYDSIYIPSGWKDSLYGNAGIRFGLAHVDPSGYCSPGYEVKIISAAGFGNLYHNFPDVYANSTGLPAWDVTRYLNVWCVNFIGNASYLLGFTVSKSQTTGPGAVSADQMGILLQFNTLGSTGPANIPPAGTGDTSGWLLPFNMGRPLTHMTGHYFEIWHTWGDDNGQCPTWSSTTLLDSSQCVSGYGTDDGLSDTPPEADATRGNPAYTIPGGTLNDCCMMHGAINTQPIGVASLSFMDATEDAAMHLFTPMQAAAMAAMVLVPPTSGIGLTGAGTIGENYNLTQNPALLAGPCIVAGIRTLDEKSSLAIYPNPTSGEINVSVNSAAETLNEIVIINLVGQQVLTVPGQGKDYYSIDLSGMSKGIYFVKCNFASGSVTRKILLQ